MRNRFTFSQVVNKNRNPCRTIFKQRPKFIDVYFLSENFTFGGFPVSRKVMFEV